MPDLPASYTLTVLALAFAAAFGITVLVVLASLGRWAEEAEAVMRDLGALPLASSDTEGRP